jgi:N-methylhydantoinase A
MSRIGIDVGGTFTDLAAVDDVGRTTLVKVASTPGDPADGVINGLKLLAEMLGLEPRALLVQTERVASSMARPSPRTR